jgi:hypothetical protein
MVGLWYCDSGKMSSVANLDARRLLSIAVSRAAMLEF